jgi:hypothetical protein
VRECEKRVEREEEEKEEEGQEVGAGQALAYHPPPCSHVVQLATRCTKRGKLGGEEEERGEREEDEGEQVVTGQALPYYPPHVLTTRRTKRAKLALVAEGSTRVAQVVGVGSCWVWSLSDTRLFGVRGV